MSIRAKSVFRSVVAAAVISIAFGQPASADLSVDRITVATGPAGTLYAQLGTALSTVIQDKTGVPSTARPHGGTSQYLPQLHRGEVFLGINSGLDANAAFTGKEPYPQAMDQVRAVLVLAQAKYSFISRAEDDIVTVADVKGKRVITAYRTLALFDDVNRAVLATAGLTEDDVQAVAETNVPSAIKALTEDRVDVTASILGIPAHREADAAIPGGTRVVALGPDDAPINALPSFHVGILEPGPAAVGVKEPTRVAIYDSYLNTGTHANADDIYTVVMTTYENWGDMQKAVPALRGMNRDDMVPAQISHPFHEGAIKAFKELGLWTPEHDQQQAKLLGQ
ncbi:TAXI family TRAP transporter solute-binding subunit [Amorphus orientalis]|uniref:TRAP transporter TAXI family solute receptor n=1 Tax=Amorphus orientalis TaxID=649198 RepID=A0AAE3VMB3_9HYPH|nr:TAXI family TRAP transporter solute-binding subunit [Amorphus orientalis]MDQ0314585.1 TRAP transporter TAXI family solute receptor [Amorphus orientalis]